MSQQQMQERKKTGTNTRPIKPRFIFWLAIILPGAGHVWLGQATRGLVFIFFIIVMFWIGNRLFPGFSFVGRHIAGIFVWGLAVLDAYKIAKIAAETTRAQSL